MSATPRTPATLDDLAASKGLDPAFLRQLGLRDVDAETALGLRVKIHERGVLIPYPSLNGKGTRSRVRQFTETSHPSKWANDGDTLGAYCSIEMIEQARKLGDLVIVEGESDCWTLWSHGIPALGVPGASMTHLIVAQHVDEIKRVYVTREPDVAGAQFPAAVAQRLHDKSWHGDLHVVDLNALHGVKDPSALYVDDPERFAERWQTTIAAARPSDEQGDRAARRPGSR